jgi:TetR/AcrR family transcriptional repressor of nem operon
MRFEKGHKEATRQRIIALASERFRKDGVEAVGIAGLMAEAGLTHGGFYAHFDSKEALVRAATAAAFEGSRQSLENNSKDLEGFIRRYLRASHRDTPEKGCAAVTLSAEIARHEPETRAVFSSYIAAIFERIAAQLPAAIPAEQRPAIARGIFSTLAGALQLSRAVTDQTLSDAILQDGIKAALKLADLN